MKLEDLTNEQLCILEQFQSLSGNNDIEANITVLKSFNWELSRAVDNLLDQNFGNSQESNKEEPSRPLLVPEAMPGANTSRPLRATPVTPPRPSILSFFTTPIIWGFRFIWNIFSFTLKLLPFWSHSNNRVQQPNGTPADLAISFQQEFDNKYGGSAIEFYKGSYNQALDRAKTDLKYLLVILYSDEHDDTDEFCRETLTAPAFVDFINNENFLVWAGTVAQSEAYKVSLVMNVQQYPFMTVMALHDSRMKIVHRFEGNFPAQQCIDELNVVLRRLKPVYDAIKSERAARSVDRNIRMEQDSAYERSLKADREKAAKAREEKEKQRLEEERLKALEMEVENKRKMKMERKEMLRMNLASEPAEGIESARINIRLPNGNRLIRKFEASAPIQVLYDYIESNNLEPFDLLSDFVVTNTYPRKEYKDRMATFKELGLTPNATVIIEEIS